MPTDLTGAETDVIVRLLREAIDNDRYPLSPRIQEMKAILTNWAQSGSGSRCR